MEKEIWKEIIGYEGLYSISNKGKVKSHERIIHSEKRGTFRIKERILSDTIEDVVLHKNGIKKTFDSRRLMLEHFKDYKPTRKTTIVNINNSPEVLSRRKMTAIAKILTKEDKSCKSTGVSKSRGLYFCQIEINGKSVFLGRHETEKQASYIYDLAEKNQQLFNGDNKDFRLKLNSLICEGKNII